MKRIALLAWATFPWLPPLLGVCVLGVAGFPERWLAVPALLFLYAELSAAAWMARRRER